MLFMAVGVEMLCLQRLRRATTIEQLREWATLTKTVALPLPLSTLAITVSGLYMVLTVWGWSAGWVHLSLAAVATMSVVGPAINSRRLEAIATAAETAPPGPIPPDLARRIQDPVLLISIYAAAGLGFGVVFLKAAKPDLLGGVVALAIAVALGVLVARWITRDARAPSAVASVPATAANERS